MLLLCFISRTSPDYPMNLWDTVPARAGFKGTCMASRRRTALGTIQETAYIPGSPQGISEPERSQSCPLLCKMSCKNRIGKKGRNWASIYNDIIIDLLVTGEMLWAIFPVSGKKPSFLLASLCTGHPRLCPTARSTVLPRWLTPLSLLLPHRQSDKPSAAGLSGF